MEEFFHYKTPNYKNTQRVISPKMKQKLRATIVKHACTILHLRQLSPRLNNRHFSTSFGQEPQCKAVCPLREHAESYIVQNESKATQTFSSMHVRGEVGESYPLSFVCTSAFASMSNWHFLKTCITTIWTRSQHERRPSSTKATRLQAAQLCSSAHLGRRRTEGVWLSHLRQLSPG